MTSLRRLYLLPWLAGVGLSQGGWRDPCEEGSSAFGNHSLFGEVLQEHLTRGTIAGIQSSLVDYDALRDNPSKLRLYLQQLCSVDVTSLQPRDAIALYCNAYNALMMSVIAHFNPPNSVLELHEHMSGGSVWKEKLGTIGGRKVSLDDIEHVYVRGSLAPQVNVQGRIHSCFVCASLSCPDLQLEPFQGATLEDQLTRATQSWLANPTKNGGPQPTGDVLLSKIFDWYGDDFTSAAGSRHSFVQLYTGWEMPSFAPLVFMEYNWGLNAVNGTGDYPNLVYPNTFPLWPIAIGLGFMGFCTVSCILGVLCWRYRRTRTATTSGTSGDDTIDTLHALGNGIDVSPRRLDLAIDCIVNASKEKEQQPTLPRISAAAREQTA